MSADDNTEKGAKRGRPPENEGLVKHPVYITPEQKRWLKSNPAFNLSGFVRQILAKRIQDEEFLSSRMYY